MNAFAFVTLVAGIVLGKSVLSTEIKPQAPVEDLPTEEPPPVEEVDQPVRMKIPVTMRGYLVGYSHIAADGSIDISVEPNPHGEALHRMLLEGTANCLSVGPFTGRINTDI